MSYSDAPEGLTPAAQRSPGEHLAPRVGLPPPATPAESAAAQGQATQPPTAEPPPRLPELTSGNMLMLHDNFHAMLWADGDKPLVHCAEGRYGGALQQGINYFFPKNTKWADIPPEEIVVWGLKDKASPLGKNAAEIAQGWARRSNDLDDPKVKTPFGRRWENSADLVLRAERWDVDAAFRAVRAFIRHREQLPLSRNRGASCSQFATYSFQAAALKVAYPRSEMLQQAVRRIVDAQAHTIKTERSARTGQREALLSDKDVQALKELMPSPLDVAAKHMTAGLLHDRLSTYRPDGAFERIGYAVPYRTPDSSGAQLMPVNDSRADTFLQHLWHGQLMRED